jgi:hypothetical protein
MKYCSFLRVAGLLLIVPLMTALPASARPVLQLSYADMTDKADLVVIATPQSTQVLEERVNLFNTDMTGVETVFSNIVVLKESNAKSLKAEQAEPTAPTLVLHHYRLTDDTKPIVNGPGLVSFDPQAKHQYLMFLKKTEDGRFEPVSGQLDPYFSIEQLRLTAK